MTELKPDYLHENFRYFTHGACARHERLYTVWSTMKHRCENPKRDNFERYGGRGISVCDEWQDPQSFIDWALSNGYEEGLQLDRVDNNGEYSPSNCRFVTPKVNSRNRRNSKFLTVRGKTKTVAEWCELIDISNFTVYWWIREKGRKYAEKRLTEAWNRRVGDE